MSKVKVPSMTQWVTEWVTRSPIELKRPESPEPEYPVLTTRFSFTRQQKLCFARVMRELMMLLMVEMIIMMVILMMSMMKITKKHIITFEKEWTIFRVNLPPESKRPSFYSLSSPCCDKVHPRNLGAAEICSVSSFGNSWCLISAKMGEFHYKICWGSN